MALYVISRDLSIRDEKLLAKSHGLVSEHYQHQCIKTIITMSDMYNMHGAKLALIWFRSSAR